MKQVPIQIDGDNVSHRHAARLAALGRDVGAVRIHRAYADVTRRPGWDSVPGVHLIHAGSEKNGSDIKLSIDAIELALTGACDSFVIASSDRDFTHIATRLRDRGFTVVGAGEMKSHRRFRDACDRFEELSASDPKPAAAGAGKPTALDRNIQTVIAEFSRQGMGMPLSELNGKMRTRFGVSIRTHTEGNWRTYLTDRADLYEVDPKGPDAFVRFKKDGFAD